MSCRRPRLFGFDEKPTEAEAEAFYFIGGAKIGFGNCLLGVFNHGPVGPAEAWYVERNPALDFGAMRACMPGGCISVPNTERVEVLLAGPDFAMAFTAPMRLPRLDDLVAEDGRRIVIAIAIVAHDTASQWYWNQKSAPPER